MTFEGFTSFDRPAPAVAVAAAKASALSGMDLMLPDGTRVRACGIADRVVDDPERLFGLYLDSPWAPPWDADVVARRGARRGAAAEMIDDWDGIVDKFVGDGAVALFIPGFAGPDHAQSAISAARALLERTGNDGSDPWIPVGVAVHTGTSFVGSVGEGDACDFTAVGDTVNTAARLDGMAGAGEILVSASAAAAAGLETSGLERRSLELRGREQGVDAWVMTADAAIAA